MNASRSYARAMLVTCAALTLVLSGCMTSKSPAKYVRATSVQGTLGSVHLRDGQTYDGELLAVDDSAFVLLRNGRVGRARFGDIQSVRFSELGKVEFAAGEIPSAKTLTRARILSRFPYGISPAAMTELLGASRQDAPDELRSQAP